MGCGGLVQVEAGRLVALNQSSSSFGAAGRMVKKTRVVVKAVAGELSSDSTTYLIAGAALVAVVGTAFPILFSRKQGRRQPPVELIPGSATARKDTCPECDGAGFVRKAGGVLRANAARKDLPQIVCQNCNGLGKLRQVDK